MVLNFILMVGLGTAGQGSGGDWDQGNPFIRGDANMDGKVNIVDPIVMLYDLFGLDLGEIQGRRPPCLDSLDADDDGGMKIFDAYFLLQYLFLNGPPPSPPFPELGRDPTFDQLGC